MFPNKSDQYTGRLDHKLSDANSFFFRGMHQTYWFENFDGGSNPAGGNVPREERTIQRWFDTSAFVVPPNGIGRFGTSGAFILEGPDVNVFHFGANKEFVLHEKARMKLEMVSTNFFNHPNANPSATVGTPAFGQILSTSGGSSTSSGEGPRDFSFTLRFIF